MAVMSAVPCLKYSRSKRDEGHPDSLARLVGSAGQRRRVPGRPARAARFMWAASAARRRASNPSPLSMAARAMRSVSS